MIKKSRVAAKPGIPRYEIGRRNRGSVFTSDGATTSDPTSSLREFDGNDDWDCLSPDTALVIFRRSLATGVTIIQLLIHKNYHKLPYPDRDPKTTSGRLPRASLRLSFLVNAMAFAPGPARTLGISPPERPRGKQSRSQIGPVHDKLRHRGSASPP